jgi:hypothetical protein
MVSGGHDAQRAVASGRVCHHRPLVPGGSLEALSLLIVAAAAFSAAAGLAVVAPEAVRSTATPAIRGIAVLAAAGAAATAIAPIGVEVADRILAAALAALLVVAAARARPAAVVGAAALVAAAGVGGTLAWPAFAGLGVAAARVSTGVRGTVPRAVAMALVAQTAVRVGEPLLGLRALAVTATMVVVAASAVQASSRRRRRKLARTAGAVAFPAVVAVLGFAVSLLAARPSLNLGLTAAQAGMEATRLGDVDTGVRRLNAAAQALSQAESQLSAWWARPARLLPVVAHNARALERVASSGAGLARSAATAAADTNLEGLRLRNASIDLAALEGLEQPLQRVIAALGDAEAELTRAHSPWLVPPLADALDELAADVDDAAAGAATAAAVAEVASPLLGIDGPRRYFVVLQNPTELRGSGGILGNFGELSVVDGRLDLVRTGRASDLNQGGTPESRRLDGVAPYLERFERPGGRFLWQDVTLSPHFPSVAGAIEQLYPRYGGAPVNGVLSLDSLAVAALLQLTGPVSVPEWPEPIGADNAADILLREQYLRLGTEGFANVERIDFLDSLVDAVFARLREGELPGPGRVGQVLGPMVSQGRIKLHSAFPDEQAIIERLGAAGALAPVEGDYLAVISNNSGGNKIDVFLDRALSYEVEYDPASGETLATAEIRLDNRAPAAGLPEYLIGSSGPVKTPPGTNRMFLSLYSPLELDGATLEGEPLPVEVRQELGRNVYSAFVTIPPGEARVVTVALSGQLPPRPDYVLDVGHQPTIEPDALEVRLRPSPGWRLDDVGGFGDGGDPTATLVLDEEQRLRVRFAPD